jgi:sugar lactone lactonase YvrE
MRTPLSFAPLALLASLALAGCTRPAEAPAPAPAESAPPAPVALTSGWETTEGIETPESVYVDSASGFIFVSQIAGAPDARDGNGRIVRMRGDGSVENANFVTGLNAPKGLRACGGSLWAADIGEVVQVDMTDGAITSRVTIPDSQFLNDVACGADNTVYVSDMMGNRIYAIANGTASVWAQGEQLEWPNGLLVDGDRLIVGGWGRPEADFTTKVPGRLFALDLRTKAKTLITRQPFANIDGVESDGRGGYVLTDWTAGKLLRVGTDGAVTELRTFPQGTADHAFVTGGNVAVVPHMNENKVAAYSLVF